MVNTADYYAIPGFEGIYEIDYFGNIRRVRGKGKRTVTPVTNEKGAVIVRLTDGNGKRKEYFLSHLVARVFLKPGPPGTVLYHRNFKIYDNFADNLAWIEKKELARLTGGMSKQKPVIKVDKEGNLVARYNSARTAGHENFMSYQAISDRCNGRIKGQHSPDGCRYLWEKKRTGHKDDGISYKLALPLKQWDGVHKLFTIIGVVKQQILQTGCKPKVNMKKLREVYLQSG